jgi:hypothetical protein
MVCVHELKKLKSDPAYPERAQLPVYLLGSKGLQDILCENGIDCFGVGPDPIENYTNVSVN